MGHDIEWYDHHGWYNAVRSDLKGSHVANCLCYSCVGFNPGTPEDNCPVANMIYATCLVTGVVTPVYECPRFIKE